MSSQIYHHYEIWNIVYTSCIRCVWIITVCSTFKTRICLPNYQRKSVPDITLARKHTATFAISSCTVVHWIQSDMWIWWRDIAHDDMSYGSIWLFIFCLISELSTFYLHVHMYMCYSLIFFEYQQCFKKGTSIRFSDYWHLSYHEVLKLGMFICLFQFIDHFYGNSWKGNHKLMCWNVC